MRLCEVEDCRREHYQHGWCVMHFARWRRHGDPNVVLQKRRRRRRSALCEAEGCGQLGLQAGMCWKHYTRWRRYGSPEALWRPALLGGVAPGEDRATLEARLLSSRVVDPVTECWLWQGAKRRGGYGVIYLGGGRENPQYKGVTRLAAELWLDLDPDSPAHVRHRCDTPPCFNPAHLLPGTPLDNAKDASERQRNRKAGTKRAKLTWEQVREIRAIPTTGHHRLPGAMTHAEVAERYGISRSVVTMIRLGRAWPEPPSASG